MIILSKYSNERTPMAKKENSFDSHKSTFHDNKLCRGWVELIFYVFRCIVVALVASYVILESKYILPTDMTSKIDLYHWMRFLRRIQVCVSW